VIDQLVPVFFFGTGPFLLAVLLYSMALFVSK